jgi:hypothetical protein
VKDNHYERVMFAQCYRNNVLFTILAVAVIERQLPSLCITLSDAGFTGATLTFVLPLSKLIATNACRERVKRYFNKPVVN